MTESQITLVRYAAPIANGFVGRKQEKVQTEMENTDPLGGTRDAKFFQGVPVALVRKKSAVFLPFYRVDATQIEVDQLENAAA